MFTLNIETTNGAFAEDNDAREEIVHILQTAANQISLGVDEGNLRDINGSTVGKYKYEAD
jgi:hypothetical protein